MALLLGVPGCAHRHARTVAPGPAAAPTSRAESPQSGSALIVTPENALTGRVIRINPSGRYVVLNFPIGHLPRVDQTLSVYHLGLKTGEVHVTDQHLDDNVVADLTAGEASPGDEVRDR